MLLLFPHQEFLHWKNCTFPNLGKVSLDSPFGPTETELAGSLPPEHLTPQWIASGFLLLPVHDKL